MCFKKYIHIFVMRGELEFSTYTGLLVLLHDCSRSNYYSRVLLSFLISPICVGSF